MEYVGFVTLLSTGQALLPALPTLPEAPPIHKDKPLFTEQQYRGYEHHPKSRELPSFRAQQQRVRHTTPAKGTTSLPGRALPTQTTAPSPVACRKAKRGSPGERPPKVRLKDCLCFAFCPAPTQSSHEDASLQRQVLGTGDTVLTREDSVLDLWLIWKMRTRWPEPLGDKAWG